MPNAVVEQVRYLRSVLEHPLNTDHKLAALARWARWHLSSRIAPGPVVVPFVNDAKLLVRPHMRGATENIYTGLAEYIEMAFLMHLLRPGDRFFDAGANVGVYTVLASAVCGASSIAVEPVPATYASLGDNLRLNHLEDLVDAKNVALGAQVGSVAITTNDDCKNHIVNEPGESVIQVPLTTVDILAGDAGVTLMKIDVEGFELAVLSGAEATLSNLRLIAVIMEINGSGDRYGIADADLDRRMRDHGFARYCYDPSSRILQAEPEAGFGTRNSIYVRDHGEAVNRLKAAPAFRVFTQSV